MVVSYRAITTEPIVLSNLTVTSGQVLQAIEMTNDKFLHIGNETSKMSLDIFDVIDFRVFSGMMGEAFVASLEDVTNRALMKNPSMDGYPDLLQNSTHEMAEYFSSCGYDNFLEYKYGGIEVKNTFGTKKSGAPIVMGDQRIGHINPKLDWKAHHRKTNHLLALFSDYYDGKPMIVAAFYSDKLIEDDWQQVQRPAEGSTMTSFSTIGKTGCMKLRQGMLFCIDIPEYLSFFEI